MEHRLPWVKHESKKAKAAGKGSTEMTYFCTFCRMQTTLRLDDLVHRQAKAEAARRGITLTQFIEDAIRSSIAGPSVGPASPAQVNERNQLMEALLRKTAHFKVGPKPTRDEMNDRSALR